MRLFIFLSLMTIHQCCFPLKAWAEPEEPPIQSEEEEVLANKIGLIQIEAKKPVFLYVPAKYKPRRAYPLVVSFPREGEDAEEHAQEWASFAERTSLIVLSPTLDIRSGDMPYHYDQWLIDLKNNLKKHYAIAENKIFLIGQDAAAEYAAYVGVNYPKEFSGVGLIHRAWKGPYSPIMNLTKDAERQIPFFVVVSPSDGAIIDEITSTAAELQEKGYPIDIEKIESDEQVKTREFKEKIYDSLVKKTEAWQEHIKSKPKTIKEKFWSAVRNNVIIE